MAKIAMSYSGLRNERTLRSPCMELILCVTEIAVSLDAVLRAWASKALESKLLIILGTKEFARLTLYLLFKNPLQF